MQVLRLVYAAVCAKTLSHHFFPFLKQSSLWGRFSDGRIKKHKVRGVLKKEWVKRENIQSKQSLTRLETHPFHIHSAKFLCLPLKFFLRSGKWIHTLGRCVRALPTQCWQKGKFLLCPCHVLPCIFIPYNPWSHVQFNPVQPWEINIFLNAHKRLAACCLKVCVCGGGGIIVNIMKYTWK